MGNSFIVTIRSHPPGKTIGAIFPSRNLCGFWLVSKSSARYGSGIVAGTFPGKMYNSFFGSLATVAADKPKFRVTTAGELCAIQSVMLNVPNSEKCPSSKPKTKCASSFPMFCSACPWPFGKYQMSPASKISVAGSPFGAITVVITVPFNISAHSAAIACQCNSRIPPGFNLMETPAICCEAGNSATAASFADPASPTHPRVASKSNLKSAIGSCFPGSLPVWYGCCSCARNSGAESSAVPNPASEAVPNKSLRVNLFLFRSPNFISAPHPSKNPTIFPETFSHSAHSTPKELFLASLIGVSSNQLLPSLVFLRCLMISRLLLIATVSAGCSACAFSQEPAQKPQSHMRRAVEQHDGFMQGGMPHAVAIGVVLHP